MAPTPSTAKPQRTALVKDAFRNATILSASVATSNSCVCLVEATLPASVPPRLAQALLPTGPLRLLATPPLPPLLAGGPVGVVAGALGAAAAGFGADFGAGLATAGALAALRTLGSDTGAPSFALPPAFLFRRAVESGTAPRLLRRVSRGSRGLVCAAPDDRRRLALGCELEESTEDSRVHNLFNSRSKVGSIFVELSGTKSRSKFN
mmetsp:Transcript_66246/g.215581  ORF Transcript_66246/g.215581 Transcript_66246/m.215581 type:complete len:207 (-) Transcript_66246:1955-2575(-)